MKKLILAVAVALFGISNAQIKTGTVYISGQANYTKEDIKSTNSTDEAFKIIPTVGVFVAPNLAVGAGFGYKNSKMDVNDVILSTPYKNFLAT